MFSFYNQGNFEKPTKEVNLSKLTIFYYMLKQVKKRNSLSYSQILTFKVSKLNLVMPKLSLVSYLRGLMEKKIIRYKKIYFIQLQHFHYIKFNKFIY